MINQSLKKELLAQLRISDQALSKRADKIQKNYGPMTSEEAKYVIAHLEGIDISKYLSLQIVDRIRALIPREIPVPKNIPSKSKSQIKTKQVHLIKYPLLNISLSNHSTK
jgi:hypothetical protein